MLGLCQWCHSGATCSTGSTRAGTSTSAKLNGAFSSEAMSTWKAALRAALGLLRGRGLVPCLVAKQRTVHGLDVVGGGVRCGDPRCCTPWFSLATIRPTGVAVPTARWRPTGRWRGQPSPELLGYRAIGRTRVGHRRQQAIGQVGEDAPKTG